MFWIELIIYLIGVSVMYVKLHTKHKEWIEELKDEEMNGLHWVVIALSWISYIWLTVKEFLDRKFIEKDTK